MVDWGVFPPKRERVEADVFDKAASFADDEESAANDDDDADNDDDDDDAARARAATVVGPVQL